MKGRFPGRFSTNKDAVTEVNRIVRVADLAYFALSLIS